jgi:uncharacterized repeat protein (TIGR03843 family)
MDDAWPPGIHRLLAEGTLELEGRLLTASNATFVGTVRLDEESVDCVYKPVRGEKPLWDFPDGTLANRERAAYLVSEVTGWHLVPPTVLREGDFGPGMVQMWVEEPEAETGTELIDVVEVGNVPEGWLRVLDAEDQHRRPVTLVHADVPALQQMAALDAVINNADRKGGHVLRDGTGAIRGVDHGVCFHESPKLRTVLWGWAGDPLPDAVCTGLARLTGALTETRTDARTDARTDTADGSLHRELAGLLSARELQAVRERLRSLRSSGRFPLPSQEWPAIPWPAF